MPNDLRKDVASEIMEDSNRELQKARENTSFPLTKGSHKISVALLTGGGDKPYALGLARELIRRCIPLEIIGSDDLDCPDFHGKPGVKFLNLRGDQRPDVGIAAKTCRILMYYIRLILYAPLANPRIFHILWNNKFQSFDRTFLMLYYRALRKKIVITAHNVNLAVRDSKDTPFNRFTLRIQYLLADHVFIHTEKMKQELIQGFGVRAERLTVIPFGINNAVPCTALTPKEARIRLGIREGQRTILFFGNIAQYKGLEYLVDAFKQILQRNDDYRLVIAGRPKGSEDYWSEVRQMINPEVRTGRVLVREEYIPDDETEIYFKAADVLALPYRHIYQSGVLFLGYSFGLPVVATDVGSLKEDIQEGETGFLCKPDDPADLAKALERYFASDLYVELQNRRSQIRRYAEKQHSWENVGQATLNVYTGILGSCHRKEAQGSDTSRASLNSKLPL